jgi:hypothetical protein
MDQTCFGRSGGFAPTIFPYSYRGFASGLIGGKMVGMMAPARPVKITFARCASKA